MKNISFKNLGKLLMASMLFLVCSQISINAQYHVTNTWTNNGTGYFELRADDCNNRQTITCIEPNDALPPIGHNYYRSNGYYYPNNNNYQTGSGNAIEACCTPKLTIKNNGNCPSEIAYNDNGHYTVYTVLQPGDSWAVNTSNGHKWIASNGGGTYTVNKDCNQTWHISPTDCCIPTLSIVNNGKCPSTISKNNSQVIILAPNDTYQIEVASGQNWTAGSGGGTYTTNNNCNQAWNINPTDCCGLNVNAPNDETICIGDSVQICATSTGAIGAVSYSWNNLLGNGSCKTVSPSSNTIYTVTATDSNNCTDSDNVRIFVTRPNGGNLAFNDGSLIQTICANEGQHTFTVNVSGETGSNQAFVITDTDLNILGLQDSPTINPSAFNEETLLIWNVSYEDIQGAVVGQNAGDLSGCFDLSNSITVNRIEVDGGSLTFADGSTSQNICINEAGQELSVSLNGAIGSNAAWVITDTDLNILALPTAPPFDLSGAGAGTCLIWNVSYEDIQGAVVGQNASNLSGCFDLSNSITVNRIEVDGGSLTFADGSTSQNICINEAGQELSVSLNGAIGSNAAWVITDTDLNILALPTAPPFDLSGAGAGTCLIWNVSYEDIQGAVVGQNAGNLSGCFDLSNSITVVREVCSNPVNIGNFVWEDLDRDGIQDANEPGVEDVEVVLYSSGPDGIFNSADDEQEDIQITDNNGLYLFEDVEPGVYLIEFVESTIPNNYLFTNQNATDNALDSDVDEFGNTAVFTIFNNQEDDLTWDAGIYLHLEGLGDPAPPIIDLRLQSAMDSNTGLMSDNLREGEGFPLTEPYSDNPNFDHTGDETTTTNVLSVSGENAIIDWVLIEVRDKTNFREVMYSRAALLQSDGSVVDVDGVSGVDFNNVPAGEYYCSISHRNHMAVMTAEPVMFNGSSQMHLDFTNPDITPIYGQYTMVNYNGVYAMWAGDINNDGQIIFQGANNDPNSIFFEVLTDPLNTDRQINFILSRYSASDLDFDNKVIYQGQNNDTNTIFFNVLTHPGNVNLSPNYIINGTIQD